jgi:hypothetical protein
MVIFYFVSSPTARIDPKKDPQGYIENCLKELLEPAQMKILPQAGYREVTKFVLYNQTRVPYLCYTSEDKQLCTMVEPMLANRIQEELKIETQAGLEKCFAKLADSWKSYDYKAGPMDYSVLISPNTLTARVNKTVQITRDGTAQEFSYFEYKESNPLFDFIILTNDILTKETNCNCGEESCSADVVMLSRMNTAFELELFITGKNEKIYTIRDTISNKEYLFSVRNCVRLP